MSRKLAFVALLIGIWAASDVLAKEPLRFVFVTCCKDEAFFQPVKQGMQDAAAALKVECEFTGTPGVDVRAQAEMVRKAVADGCDGIALNLIDAHAFDDVIAEATKRSIPVVAFNVDAQGAAKQGTRGDPAAKDSRRLSAVCQDFVKAGNALGEKAIDFVPKGSKVLITLHDRGISALDERQQGIEEVLKRHHIESKVICSTNEPQKAVEVITAELRADPAIRCVLGTGQTDTEAAGTVVERHFASQSYKVAGFDLSPEILRMIKSGVIECTVDQQPYMQGYYPVVQLTLLRRYGIQPSDVDAGAGIIMRKDVDRVLDLSKSHHR